MKKILLITLQLSIATVTFAETTTIITQTKTWESVPITVNQTAHTYTTVEGALPSGDYYYSYPGYRCVKKKVTIVGGDENVVIYRGGTGGGEIYCYPAP